MTGAVLAAVTLAVIGTEWTGIGLFGPVSAVLTVVAIGLLLPGVHGAGRAFVFVGAVLTVVAMATGTGWATLSAALQKSAFIGAFFTALTSLRHAADTSPAIIRCGKFLAEQPPGRRYAALTAGGHLFALLLNYGAIALLGSLAVNSAQSESDAELRGHRTRRMLLAIQRGFIASLPWSPLAFAMAISTAIIPGATWAGAVLPCLVSAAILIVTGWALDTIFKPKLSGARLPPRRAPIEGSWALMLPLLGLLAILVVSVGTLQLATGIHAVGIVIVVVPLISVGWWIIQAPAAPLANVMRRGGGYLGRDLPGYQTELTLLMLAGLIGTMGGALLAPVVVASGLDLTVLPAWAILLALVWGIPLVGQIGANPILAVTLFGPLLPAAAAMGLDPSDYILAITAGWTLSGLTSPYTATTLLVGSFGGVSARHVGLVWNRGYVAVSGTLLSLWVLISAAL